MFVYYLQEVVFVTGVCMSTCVFLLCLLLTCVINK